MSDINTQLRNDVTGNLDANLFINYWKHYNWHRIPLRMYSFTIRRTVELSLCFNWARRHEYVLGEWWYSSTPSLTSALDGGEWSASRPGRFTRRERAPRIHWIGGWMGTRAVLDAVVKRKISSPCWVSNPRSFSPDQSYTTELPRVPISFCNILKCFPFAATYLHETVFSCYDATKTKYRSKSRAASNRKI
jgi:hypothetical protein